MSEKYGPGIDVSRYTNGTESFACRKKSLDEEVGEPIGVNVLFNHAHTIRHDRVTFVDERSRKFNEDYQRRLEEMTLTSPKVLVDEDELF
ncbi:hypothetical protein Scep_014566 [Stephania cephalantha]|uniref:Uncharacterized protein n=1 Tax=Stephania cephalantha TaxID=152367 RepID=A0AAP0J286_9MAGN